jgi:hypothetical protein
MILNNELEMEVYIKSLAEKNKIDKSLITLTYITVNQEDIESMVTLIKDVFKSKQNFSFSEVIYLLLCHEKNEPLGNE